MRYYSGQGETEALSEISFSVAAGEFTSIVGPSGCGKSTFLSLAAGMLKPASGEILLDGVRVTGPSRRIGYMLQHDHLFEWRTVMDNCLVGPEVQGMNLSEARERVKDFLRRTGLYGFRNAYPDQLSGGMRQRAALVRTLAIDPDVLLLDEAFSALDFPTRLTLQDEVSAILRQERKTAILVTHDISEAVSMSDRVLVISQRPGRIKAEHTIEFNCGGRLTPFQARESPEYPGYFHRIWEEMDVHVHG